MPLDICLLNAAVTFTSAGIKICTWLSPCQWVSPLLLFPALRNTRFPAALPQEKVPEKTSPRLCQFCFNSFPVRVSFWKIHLWIIKLTKCSCPWVRPYTTLVWISISSFLLIFSEIACWAFAILFFRSAQEMLETKWQLWGWLKWCDRKNKGGKSSFMDKWATSVLWDFVLFITFSVSTTIKTREKHQSTSNFYTQYHVKQNGLKSRFALHMTVVHTSAARLPDLWALFYRCLSHLYI